jgi:hypothetical protein
MLTTELIKNRINTFWGYGNLNSDIWFIGMEEGFHGNLTDLDNIFNKTKDDSVIDLQDGMTDVQDHMKWFSPNSRIQRTWGKLILILLTLKSDEEVTNDKIKEFQRKEFGRLNSNHCSLEFMPLPCRSIRKKDWFYNKFEIDYLETRKKYLHKIMPLRIKLFQDLIMKYSPKTIIFYSFSYLEKWKAIIGCNLLKRKNIYHCKKDNFDIFIIPHSTAHGMTNNDWNEIAQNIKLISNS